MDLVYSLWIDDLTNMEVSRAAAREKLDEAISEAEDKEPDPETFGLTPDAVAAAEAKDKLWESATFG